MSLWPPKADARFVPGHALLAARQTVLTKGMAPDARSGAIQSKLAFRKNISLATWKS
jgi:hypothetical protein